MPSFKIVFSITVLLLLTILCSNSQAQEWTRFRGPNGTGETEVSTIPTDWKASDIRWKVDVPGIGHSSPVLWGELLFVLSANPDDATRHCLCYSAVDGKLKWKVDYKSELHHLHQRSSYASCTPATDESHVYFAWSTPNETTLKALDHHGKEVWSKNLGRWVSQHGFGTSPIVYKDLVILNNSQDDETPKSGEKAGESFMMAFDRKTGQERWRTPMKSEVVSYSVPFIYEHGGHEDIVCTNSGNGVFGINGATGKMEWQVPGLFKMRTVSSPVLAGGLIFGSCGSGAYSDNVVIAVRPGDNPEVAYELKNSSSMKAPYVPSLVKRGELLFLMYDKGFAACVDAATGKAHWFERTNAAFSGSPIRVGDRIFCVDEDGVVWVFAADKQYQLLAKNPLGEACRSTPAVANGKMFVRTYSHLFCIGG